MTENRIKLLGALVGAVLMVGIGFGFYALVSSCSTTGVPRDRAIEFYNEDSHYFTVIGQVLEYHEKSDCMPRLKLSTGDVEYECDIPSDSAVMLRLKEFDFSVGGVYKFTMGNCYGDRDDLIASFPIVAVKSVSGSVEYLPIKQGRANLIKYLEDTLTDD